MAAIYAAASACLTKARFSRYIMVQVVSYGSLPVARLPESSKRLAAMRFAIVACAALACAAVVTFVSSGPTVLYSGDPNPAALSDDQVQ